MAATAVLLPEMLNVSAGGGKGNPSVAVGCVDIWKNTGGEGDSLDCN